MLEAKYSMLIPDNARFCAVSWHCAAAGRASCGRSATLSWRLCARGTLHCRQASLSVWAVLYMMYVCIVRFQLASQVCTG